MYNFYRRSKYNARKAQGTDGEIFDSVLEMRRWQFLKIAEKGGLISGLTRQKKFLLIPAQYEETGEVYTRGKNKGRPKPGKLLEKECSYYADFEYYKDGRQVVEDAKGVETKEFKIKKKLMLERHGLVVKVVKTSTDDI